MILVTVGMHTQPFDRLVRAADEMASLIEERTVIQRGITSYVPEFARHVDYVDETQMQKWLSETRVVVSHSGAGSILSTLQAGKPLVMVPRMRRFGEHFDDHQLELAEALAEQGRAVMVTHLSAEVLREAIAQATRLTSVRSAGSGLQSALRAWLAEQAAQPALRWWELFRWKRGGG